MCQTNFYTISIISLYINTGSFQYYDNVTVFIDSHVKHNLIIPVAVLENSNKIMNFQSNFNQLLSAFNDFETTV